MRTYRGPGDEEGGALVREERGPSQILFNFLPQQTADLHGGVWRVVEWRDARELAIDNRAICLSVERAAMPWILPGRDGGLRDALRRGEVRCLTLDRDRGVRVEEFPRMWRCRRCGRIADSVDAACPCGARRRGQLHFVAYHDCGYLDSPPRPTCDHGHHGDVALRDPGSAAVRDLEWRCIHPACGGRVLQRGFPPRRCRCPAGGFVQVTVHRAGVVFTPRVAVLVNPPDPETARRLQEAGGGARALDWVLDGMPGSGPWDVQRSSAAVREALAAQGLGDLLNDPEIAQRIFARAGAGGDRGRERDATLSALSGERREVAQRAALDLAAAVAGGRDRVEGLAAQASPAMAGLYRGVYPRAIREAGLEAVDFIPSFPVVTLVFGYTRGDPIPGASALVPFLVQGRVRTYGLQVSTEALLFRLDPVRVARWLRDAGHVPRAPDDPADARLTIVERTAVPPPGENPARADPAGAALLRLVHSFAHRTIRQLSALAGIERDSLAEYLVPEHLAFIIYAATRGDFVLGGLQAVFETRLHELLDRVRHAERRCPFDPACRRNGAACVACLHLGEPSCRGYNRYLSRLDLFAPGGVLA